MPDASYNHLSLMAEPCSSEAQLIPEFGEIVTTHILQFDPLQIAPDSLVRIEVRRVARQPFEMNALGSTRRQKILNGVAAVDRCTVPQNQHLARDVPQHMLEKAYDIRAPIGSLLDLQQQLPIRGDRTNRRQVVVAQGDAQQRRLPTRRIGTHQCRQQIEAGCVYPDQGAPFLLRFF